MQYRDLYKILHGLEVNDEVGYTIRMTLSMLAGVLNLVMFRGGKYRFRKLKSSLVSCCNHQNLLIGAFLLPVK